MNLSEGRYELERVPLARGGMGEVWLGRDTKLDREIAVKFLRFPDGFSEEELVRRFVRESRITARLEHPGVPAVYDVGTHDGRPFLVMQRVHGISVADLVAEQGPLPIGWAVAIAAQVCSVLAAAHAASLVHRDLKPANLMLEPDGAVKVLDFGLAVAPTLADFSRITHTNQPLGTPAYMAPEQVEANLSEPATDLYALGCTLHEMLAGSHVFNGPTSFSQMAQQVKDAPPPLRTLRPEVPYEVERLVLDLLEKKPQDRPVGAGAVYQRLLPFVSGLGPLPGALHPPGTLSPVRLYAGVLGKVFAERPETGPATVPTGRPVDLTSTAAAAPAAPPPVNRRDLFRVRDEADSLLRQSRFQQAAEALSAALESARRVFGETDPDVLQVRRQLATALFDGGDYRHAAPIFQALGADLASSGGQPQELWFESRMKEATCYALTGRTSQALKRLSTLLTDYRRAYGDRDARTLHLREQIGLLQLGSGQRGTSLERLDDLPTVGWHDVLHYADGDEPAMAALLDALAGRGLRPPVVGYELGDEGWAAELAWPDRKVAVLLPGDANDPETTQRDAAFAAAGWDARTPDRWTVDELAGRVAA